MSRSKLAQYAINFALLLDEAVNTVFGGSPNETISERAAKARNNGRRWGCVLCKCLDWINPGHCDGALTVKVGQGAVIPDGE